MMTQAGHPEWASDMVSRLSAQARSEHPHPLNRVEMDKLQRHLGNRICHLRKKKGMTQEELARAVETNSLFIKKFEKGEMLLDLMYVDDLKRIAEACDVELSELLKPLLPSPLERLRQGVRQFWHELRLFFNGADH